MLFKFSKRKHCIDFTKHSLSSFIFFHKKPIFILIFGIFWCISWMWPTGEVFTANNPKPNFVFATKELSKSVNSVYVFNEGWINNISNGAVFISQSCQFVFKRSLEVGSSLLEFFSPVSAFAEDVGKPGAKESSYSAKEKSSNKTSDLHFLSILIGIGMGWFSFAVGMINHHLFYS